MEPIKISNSDTKTWQCKRKFYYAYNYGITARNMGMSLSKGIFGHKLLERWYTEKSMKAVEDEYNIQVELIDPSNDFAMKDATQIYFLVLEYINYYYHGEASRVPKIVEVEKNFELDLYPIVGERLTFKFKPDLIWEDPDTGKLAVIDNKFVYDFYRPTQLALDTQIPKYVTALGHLGYDIHYGVINQLRTRNVKTERFNREVLIPNKDQYANVWQDHIIAAREIAYWFAQPSEAQEQISPRCYNMMICRNCFYQDLCVAELMGNKEEARDLIETTMEPYNYGQATLKILQDREHREANGPNV